MTLIFALVAERENLHYSNFMKKLTAPDTVFIASSFSYTRKGRHDKFPRDPSHMVSASYDRCASGLWVGSFTSFLISGDEFNYPTILAKDLDTVQNFFDYWKDIPVPSFPLNYIGEYYNIRQRPLAFDKVPVADFPAWLAAH